MIDERKLEEFFLANFCRNYPCGSQRCDGSDECVEYCRKYIEFRNTVTDKIEWMLKR